MRFDQQKSASFPELGRVAALAGAPVRFRQRGVRFRTGAGRRRSAPPVVTPPAHRPRDRRRAGSPAQSTLGSSSEEAVKMALENNLGIRAEQLNPQIQTYARRPGPRRVRAEPVLDDDDAQQHDAARQLPDRHGQRR